jgi:hypothetical protein
VVALCTDTSGGSSLKPKTWNPPQTTPRPPAETGTTRNGACRVVAKEQQVQQLFAHHAWAADRHAQCVFVDVVPASRRVRSGEHLAPADPGLNEHLDRGRVLHTGFLEHRASVVGGLEDASD